MIFWRIVDNKVYSVKEVEEVGFKESEGLRIPDEYLDNQEFVIMRTCHGIGDWGLLSAMPRLLKEKYPNCKVYIPSTKLLEQLFGNLENNWGAWNNPFLNAKTIFDNNPYVDGYKDEIDGEVFHDHYKINNNDDVPIPLIEQMLKFWQFEGNEYINSQPELYFSDEEINLGNKIIEEYVGNNEFGALIISDRYDFSSDILINKVLEDNAIPYFYYSSVPLEQTSFNFIDKALDMRHMNLRIQIYIKCKAKINISNQCGANHIAARYSDCYEVQRQFPIAHNFVEGETYL